MSDENETAKDIEIERVARVRPKQERRPKGHIRRPGRVADVPEKWKPTLETGFRPTWAPSDPTARKYEAALRALIEELRKRGSGAIQISLKDGQQVKVDDFDVGYQFAWDSDEQLFEGAKLEAIADGTRTKGRVVALSNQKIIVAFDSELGPIVTACLLIVDNTAFLEVLADRLRAVAAGEQPGFNAVLAEAVIANDGEELAPAPIPMNIVPQLINEAQIEAVGKALANKVFYLWGPPGTGKTSSLSAISQALFDAGKRVLLCSNTNQAVDQVLKNLCDSLARKAGGDRKDSAALNEGLVVRIGRIANDGPLATWTEWVTIKGIAERRSVDLRTRLSALEEEETRVRAGVDAARKTISLFQESERFAQTKRHAEDQLTEKKEKLDIQQHDLQKTEGRVAALEAELNESRRAGFISRFFRRSPETIEVEITRSQQQLHVVTETIRRLGIELQATQRQVANASRDLERAFAAVRGKDRAAAERQVKEADEVLAPIQREVAEIRRQLSKMEEAILQNARIVGATATKLFLSPNDFARFDVVIVDEASMLVLPALYYAAGLAGEKVIVSGDFRQLPPIVQSRQKTIVDEIGRDVFSAAGIQRAFDNGDHNLKRTTLLNLQYRMAPDICDLISKRMYSGKLSNGEPKRAAGAAPAPPFDGALTVIDTSSVGPFAVRDATGSKINLMSALVLRNFCRSLTRQGFSPSDSKDRVGAVAPYAAQRKLIQRLLADAELQHITAGTVHRFQGDQKDLIIIDLTDGLGLKTAGLWLQADEPSEDGAKLFNVAISRAQNHLVFIGDLSWLDRKLPEGSFLRGWLYRAQEKGTVVDAREVLGLWPIAEDLRKYAVPLPVDEETLKSGVCGQNAFDRLVFFDIARAKKGIAIWSGFVTPQRVAHFGDVLRLRVDEGVKVRCVIPPFWRNGSIKEQDGRAAFDALEGMRCIVDTRLNIHQKAVIIDDEIVWFGSLNPLSFSGTTSETMARFEGKQAALQFVTALSADRSVRAEKAEGKAYERENPECGCGKTRATLVEGKRGRFWRCLERTCDWTQDASGGKRGAVDNDAADAMGEPPPCPKCGAKMRVRMGRYGPFFGCTDYPKCDGVVRASEKRSTSREKRSGVGSRAAS